MKFVRRLLVGLLVVVLVALVGGYWYARPLLLTGTGYAAHNDCAVTTLAGRSDAAADLPPNPLVPYLRFSRSGTQFTSTVFGLLAGQTAWSTAGGGCTIADSPPQRPAVPPASHTGNPFTFASPPAPNPTLQPLVASAFGDDLPAAERAALGTRAVVAVQDGKLVAERYGEGFTLQTRQLGWSMAKSVANLVVGRYVQEGKVSLDRDQLFPEWTDERSKITLEDLMRMTSGLEWDETYDLGTAITRMLYLEPDMPKFVAAQKLTHDPGTYQMYSSGSTNLECAVLVRTGVPGERLVRDAIFEPLGLSSAVMETDAKNNPVCSSYVWATPRDWAAIGQFALQNGVWNGKQLLPPTWMKESTTVKPVAVTEETGYAAGWWVNRKADGSLVDPALPADAYWASGHDGQRVFVVPSARLVVVRLGFSPTVDSADLRIVPLVAALSAPR